MYCSKIFIKEEVVCITKTNEKLIKERVEFYL
jgi:hypothetical protein